MSHPPSMTNSPPVEYDASSDARKSARRATSIGVPTRGIGRWASGLAPAASSPARAISVSIAPGWIEFTRIASGASSSAAAFVMPRMANLLATYDMMPAPGVMPFIDEMLTIDPPPPSPINGAVVFMPSQHPIWLTLMTAWYSSSDTSSIMPKRMIPALFTRMSSRPNRARAVSTAARQLDSSVTSSATLTAEPGKTRVDALGDGVDAFEHVAEDDSCSFSGEQFGLGLTLPACGPRDECDLAVQPATHEGPPEFARTARVERIVAHVECPVIDEFADTINGGLGGGLRCSSTSSAAVAAPAWAQPWPDARAAARGAQSSARMWS